MDPDQALRDAREAAHNCRGDTPAAEDAWALADAFEALDEWLSRGGFPPATWAPWSQPVTVTACVERAHGRPCIVTHEYHRRHRDSPHRTALQWDETREVATYLAWLSGGEPIEYIPGALCDRCGHFAARHGPAGCRFDNAACRHGCDTRPFMWGGVEWPRPWLPAPEGLRP